jgi:hypothetical protein
MAAPPPVKPRPAPSAATAGASGDKQQAQTNVAFKVLRMNRPTFAMPGLPLHCSAVDSASLGTDALVLPKAFGTIFLGEVNRVPNTRALCSYFTCAFSYFTRAGFPWIRCLLQQWGARFHALCGRAPPHVMLPPFYGTALTLLPPFKVKAEINCGARRTPLVDTSSQPIAVLPARST